MEKNRIDARNTLKIVEEIAIGNYKNELSYLKKLVHSITVNKNFNISS